MDPKGERGYEENEFSKRYWRYCSVHEEKTMTTKGWVQLNSNDTYFSDIWFSGVKTAEKKIAEGVYYCGLVKTIHKGFCLDKLEKLTQDWPGGSYLIMKSTPRVHGDIPLMEIGYN